MKGLCGTCKYVVYCTYRSDRAARWCDEYEDAGSAQEHDWNLLELLKLYPTPEAEIENRPAEQ